MRLYKDQILEHEDGDKYSILYTTQLRGKYLYIISDKNGGRITLSRNQILDALQRGVFKIVCPQ